MNASTVEDVQKAPLYGFDPNLMTLYIKSIPAEVNRLDVLAIIKETEGFVSFSLSEPLK